MALRRAALSPSRRSSRILKQSAGPVITDTSCGGWDDRNNNHKPKSKGHMGTIAQFNPSVPELYYYMALAEGSNFLSADFTVWPHHYQNVFLLLEAEEKMTDLLDADLPVDTNNGTTLQLDTSLASSGSSHNASEQDELCQPLDGSKMATTVLPLVGNHNDEVNKTAPKPRRRSTDGLNIDWDPYRNTKKVPMSQDEKQILPNSPEAMASTAPTVAKSLDEPGMPKQQMKRRPSLKDLMFPKASERNNNNTNETSIKKKQAAMFAKKILHETKSATANCTFRRSHSFRGLFGGSTNHSRMVDDDDSSENSQASFAEDETGKEDHETQSPKVITGHKESSRPSRSCRRSFHGNRKLPTKQSELAGSRSNDHRTVENHTIIKMSLEDAQCHVSRPHRRRSHSNRRLHKSSSHHRRNDSNHKRREDHLKPN